MIEEVRRQFKNIPGLLEGDGGARFGPVCRDLDPRGDQGDDLAGPAGRARRRWLTGFLLGVSGLGGLLAGALVTGVLMALMMANAGGVWDNAKKYID